MLDEWFDMEIFGSPRFWISLVLSVGISIYVISTWVGKIQGTTGYYIMAIIASIIGAYALTMRDIEKNG